MTKSTKNATCHTSGPRKAAAAAASTPVADTTTSASTVEPSLGRQTLQDGGAEGAVQPIRALEVRNNDGVSNKKYVLHILIVEPSKTNIVDTRLRNKIDALL